MARVDDETTGGLTHLGGDGAANMVDVGEKSAGPDGGFAQNLAFGEIDVLMRPAVLRDTKPSIHPIRRRSRSMMRCCLNIAG